MYLLRDLSTACPLTNVLYKLLVSVMRELLDHAHMASHQILQRLNEPQVRVDLAVLLARVAQNIVRLELGQSAADAPTHHRFVVADADGADVAAGVVHHIVSPAVTFSVH